MGTALFVARCINGNNKRIDMFGEIRRIISLFYTISITKTIYLNFKVFPVNIAKKLPIYVGKNVDINEVYKGSIEI